MQQSTEQPILFFGLDSVTYPTYRDELINLYTLSFTEGAYAQYIPPDAIEFSLDEIMRVGFGFIALDDENVMGAILCVALKNDPDFPFNSHPDINPETTLYIADVMVDPQYRGQGVATSLIKHLLKESETKP